MSHIIKKLYKPVALILLIIILIFSIRIYQGRSAENLNTRQRYQKNPQNYRKFKNISEKKQAIKQAIKQKIIESKPLQKAIGKISSLPISNDKKSELVQKVIASEPIQKAIGKITQIPTTKIIEEVKKNIPKDITRKLPNNGAYKLI